MTTKRPKLRDWYLGRSECFNVLKIWFSFPPGLGYRTCALMITATDAYILTTSSPQIYVYVCISRVFAYFFAATRHDNGQNAMYVYFLNYATHEEADRFKMLKIFGESPKYLNAYKSRIWGSPDVSSCTLTQKSVQIPKTRVLPQRIELGTY